jgi:hypothetical protein
MSNKKLAKAIRDGVNAPPGSTARKHAQQILSVMKKTGARDGSGGPGPMPVTQFTPNYPPPMPRAPQPLGNVRVFKAPPKMRIPFGQKAPAAAQEASTGIIQEAIRQGIQFPQRQPQMPTAGPMDGAGGAFSTSTFSGVPLPGSEQTGATTTMGTLGVQPKQGFWSGLVSSMSRIFGGRSSTTHPDSSPSVTLPSGSFANLDLPGYNTGYTTPSTYSNIPTPQITPSGATPSSTLSASSGDTSPFITTQPKTGGETPGGETPSDGTPTPGGSGSQTGGDTSGPGTGANTGSITTTPLSKMYPQVQQAVNSGMGANMFAIDALNRPDYLKTLPGMSGFSDEALSGGASLQERLTEVQKATRSEFDLDQKLGQLTNLINSGVGLEGRLTDYIRGRDEFLNETDQMLESFKDQVLTMNMADPLVRNSAEQYSNYLYELRGRQNKRYVEFLNSSIDVYNSQLQASENLYNNAFDAYERALNRETAIATDEYNMIYTGLTELYNSVLNEPKRLLELQQMQNQVNSTALENLKDAYDQANTDNLWNQDYLDALENLKKANIIDSDGILKGPISVSDFATWQTEKVASQSNLLRAIVQSVTKEMGPDEDGNNRDPEFIQEKAGSVLNLINQLEDMGQLNAATARSWRQNISNAMVQTFRQTDAFDNQVDGIREAIQWLSTGDTSNWPFNKGDAATREEFLAEFADSGISPVLLETIYSDFDDEGYKNNREAFATEYLNYPDGTARPDQDLLENVLKQYSHSLSGITTYVTGETAEDDLIKLMLARPIGYDHVRNVRNNNPLNIKSLDQTQGTAAIAANSHYGGVTGTDPYPADDGGYFLTFDSWDSGMEAAIKLITSNVYSDLTVDAALKKWSGGGYGADRVAPEFANTKISDLSYVQLVQILAGMEEIERGGST